jgi:hypothetical protein
MTQLPKILVGVAGMTVDGIVIIPRHLVLLWIAAVLRVYPAAAIP